MQTWGKCFSVSAGKWAQLRRQVLLCPHWSCWDASLARPCSQSYCCGHGRIVTTLSSHLRSDFGHFPIPRGQLSQKGGVQACSESVCSTSLKHIALQVQLERQGKKMKSGSQLDSKKTKKADRIELQLKEQVTKALASLRLKQAVVVSFSPGLRTVSAWACTVPLSSPMSQ